MFLLLDDPDHPENIFVKIEKESSRKESLLFLAPETLSHEIKHPTESSLVWNMGMIFYYLLYKTPYFESID